MPKRRRERDRPKAGPEALYHPNKRVVLSYESDEEGQDEDAAVAESQSMLERAVPDYTEDISDERDPQAKEGAKSAHSSLDEHPINEQGEIDEWGGEAEEELPANETTLWDRTVSKNNRTGQWAALGSLSYQYEDWEEDEDEELASEEEEAMAYLRAVRSERQAMPDFFVARQTYTHSELYNNGTGDTRGHYEDGAYIAAPISGPTIPESAKTTVEPHEAFATAVKARFLEQRRQMHVKPSQKAPAPLDERHPTSLPKSNNKAYANWLRILKTTTPQSNHIRSMEQAGVIRVLELIQNRFLQREKDITPNMSAWIWSLLARLDDVGTMDGDRIALLREFGKKAVLVQLSFRDPEAAAQLEEISAAERGDIPPKPTVRNSKNDDGSTGENKAGSKPNDTTSAATKVDQPEETTRHDEAQRTNTLATLDTIIVLVGDVFGQRDLLEFRSPWAEEDDSNKKINGVNAADTADVDATAKNLMHAKLGLELPE